MESIEDEIRNSLLGEGKEEIISGMFKISIKRGGGIEVTELPQVNLEQLELPLTLRLGQFEKGGKEP